MGLTSRAGVAPLNLLADIAGPMARTLEDAVAVLQVIVGEDPDDPITLAPFDKAQGSPFDTAQGGPELRRGTRDYVQPGLRPGGRPPAIHDYRAALVRDALRGARIGVLRQAYERDTTDPEIVSVFMKAVADMKSAGAIVVDPATVDLSQVRRAQGAATCGGFKYDINQYLAGLGARAPVHSLEEIVRSRRFHPSVQLRLERAQESTEMNGPESAACKAEADYREQFRAAVLKSMDAERLDAFVYPTWSNPPRLIGDLNTPHGDNSQVYSPLTGWPAVQVPMGYTRGVLPAGITILGRAWSEAMLFKLAYAYEQATHHRRPPPSAPPLGAGR
jgi:Asp-tRNA(Asn)/Glu-tRNA(Gln) amidotransferase A subunit family amidase